MKRLAILFALALTLGGCADIKTAFDVATTPVTITEETVYKSENALKAVTVGFVGYRRLCIKKVIDPVTRNCRAVIERVQPYTKSAALAIVDMRKSVRENNQVNALAAYNALQSLLTNIQNERQKAGVI